MKLQFLMVATNLDKSARIRGKTEEVFKFFVRNICLKSSEIAIFLSEIQYPKSKCPKFQVTYRVDVQKGHQFEVLRILNIILSLNYSIQIDIQLLIIIFSQRGGKRIVSLCCRGKQMHNAQLIDSSTKIFVIIQIVDYVVSPI